VYRAALADEFNHAGIRFEKEKTLPVLDVGFRCDFLVAIEVIVECKAVQGLTLIDQAKVLNYLKITKLQVGLLINFNVLVLKDGIRRVVNNLNE